MLIIAPINQTRIATTKQLTLLFTVMLWLTFASQVQSADSTQLSARVVSLIGSARYCDTNREWNLIGVGADVTSALALQTSSKDSITDLALAGPAAGGQCIVRMSPNCVLKLIKLNSNKLGSSETRNISLDVAQGQIRIKIDGASDYSFQFRQGRITSRLTIPRNGTGPQETAFLVDDHGSLTVLIGAVQAGTAPGSQKLVNAGEQLRGNAIDVTKAPPTSPELKLEP